MNKYPMNVTNVTNETVEKSEYAGSFLDIDIFEVRDAIYNYCIEHNTKPRKITAKITAKGMLTINDEIIIRVAPLPIAYKKIVISEECAYFENKILSNQETYFD